MLDFLPGKGVYRIYIAYWHEKWSVSLPIRSIHYFATTH